MGQAPASLGCQGCSGPGSAATQTLGCCESVVAREAETIAAEGSVTGEPSDIFGPLSPALSAAGSPSDDFVDKLTTSALEVDRTVLRGIAVRKLLQLHMWRRRATTGHEESERLYARSEPTEALGAFLSHSWDSDGALKVVTLILQTSWPLLVTCWLLSTGFVFTLGVLDLLPMPFIIGPREGGDPFGCWILATSILGIILGMFLAAYFPGGALVFMDKACVHQSSLELKRRAIYSIGGFLQVSKELWVLWSPQYLSRLWCVFEIAAFRIGNPQGRIRILPLFMSKTMVLMYIGLYLASCTMWLFIALGVNNFFMVVPCLLPLTPLLHSLRRNCCTKDQLLDELRTFHLASLRCSTDSDRAQIVPTIVRWYGSEEVFEYFVRTTLYEELKQIQGTPRYAHHLLIVTSPLALGAERLLSVIKSGMPLEGVLSRLLAVHVGVHIFICLICIRFLFHFTVRYASPCRSGYLDWAFSATLTAGSAVIYASNLWLASVMVEYGLLASAIYSIMACLSLVLTHACWQPFFVIHKQRRQASQKTTAGESKAKDAPPPSSADLWQKKIQQHLRSMDVDMSTTPRKHWPLEALRRTFDEMQADGPADLIRRELLLSSLHPGQHFVRTAAFANSVGLSSVLGHLIGLGDRHLDNLLLDLITGEVVHVDYSICFDRGARLRVPERVPFRLSRCMVHALGAFGVSGPLVATIELGLGLLAEWQELFMALAEPCLRLAPVNDWLYPVTSPYKPPISAPVRPQEPSPQPAPTPPPETPPEDPAPSPASETNGLESKLAWPALGTVAKAPPAVPTTEAGSDDLMDEESSADEKQEGRDDEEEGDGGRTDTSPNRAEEECLLAQDREEVDDPLGGEFARALAPRAGSGALAEAEHAGPADTEGEGREGEEFSQASEAESAELSGGELPEPPGAPRSSAPSCALAAFALRSLRRKLPRPGASLAVEAESLIAAATDPDELAQMYEGWTSWI
ncbi:smg1 [Symbiodinium natans]|uniref:Smg1 protein n=1 Tax=Symbiodinium natans TaxID=878477 RepID=A0A812LA66_9DINO|nr:smg1 [Symbiodinium natans]